MIVMVNNYGIVHGVVAAQMSVILLSLIQVTTFILREILEVLGQEEQIYVLSNMIIQVQNYGIVLGVVLKVRILMKWL